MSPKTIIFLGPQGSGKGTQVSAVYDYLQSQGGVVAKIETGKPFRELSARGGYAATRVRAYIDAGQLVPSVITNALVVRELLDTVTPDTHLVFDGYPRDIAQAHILEEALVFFERTALTVIHLDTPDDVVTARMRERGRSDDTEAVIAERLRLYHELTEPVVEYYQSRATTDFIAINGALSIEAVTADICAHLG
jgi:adenylate kinase